MLEIAQTTAINGDVAEVYTLWRHGPDLILDCHQRGMIGRDAFAIPAEIVAWLRQSLAFETVPAAGCVVVPIKMVPGQAREERVL